jgi:hypothetical protein
MESKNYLYCNELLGLCSTIPDCKYDQKIHAFSFDRDILNNMIMNVINPTEKDFFSIKKIKLYEYVKIDSSEKASCFFGKNTNSFYICRNSNNKYNNLRYPIYGFNHTKKTVHERELCTQVLLSTNEITDFMKICGISSNPININTFYEDSILTA